jgi:hypothetical protein
LNLTKNVKDILASGINPNVVAVCGVADYEARHYQPLQTLIREHNFKHSNNQPRRMTAC